MLQHFGDLVLRARNEPVRLIAMASFHPASDTFVLGPASPSVPALLKAISSLPNFAKASALLSTKRSSRMKIDASPLEVG
jgi:hypothetical protein